ncbi:hypothetical protein GTP56_17100 [Duganella sp. FT134W]|uniref:Uncharacterized protein n=1 Tax=Duganella margarita TaxID=2692170 RepID=A0A7X4H3G0_9BURK|nr:hypothetical protein [Duganella margarita]MYM73909.1 hypothetical protein [Duganella margarita]
MTNDQHFLDVPRIMLLDGTDVPAFRVAKYLCGCGGHGVAIVMPVAPLWTLLNYFEAASACRARGHALISARQCLAIAHDICLQSVNWSGGAIGMGKVFLGLHKGSIVTPQ